MANFIEVSNRRDPTQKISLNKNVVIKVSDDGTGANISYTETIGEKVSTRTIVVVETYADVMTALNA